MKRWLKRIALILIPILLLVGMYAYAFRDEIRDEFRRELKAYVEASISRGCTHLPEIDEVVLLRLKASSEATNMGTYDVSVTESPRRYIVQRRNLTGEEALGFAARWRKLQLNSDNVALCYNPHHVIQFYSKGSCVAEAVVCFDCGNTTLTAFPFRPLVSFESPPNDPSAEYVALKGFVEAAVGKAH